MFVAFCDHAFGNSTSFCSKATLPPWPMSASRVSHSTLSNGWTPGLVKNLRIVSAWPSRGSWFSTRLVWGVVLTVALLTSFWGADFRSLRALRRDFGGNTEVSASHRTERSWERSGGPFSTLLRIGVVAVVNYRPRRTQSANSDQVFPARQPASAMAKRVRRAQRGSHASQWARP